jgi:hypothetical protein
MPRKTKSSEPKENEIELDSKEQEDSDESLFIEVDYTDDEYEYRSERIALLTQAQIDYNNQWDELNGMTTQEYYDSNLRAANSFIAPKKNTEDTRIVTGTTEEKGVSLLSAILNYNLEPNIQAYDKLDFLADEVGSTMEDLIRKSRHIENYDDRRRLIYKELLDQGTCFVEETWVEPTHIEKKLKSVDWKTMDPRKITWTELVIDDEPRCETRLLRGDKVFLGNLREFEIDKQPFIFTVDIIPYEVAKWKYVPKNVVRTPNTENSTYRHWTLTNVEKGFVEVIKYQNKLKNDFMISLSGVDMLPAKFPLSAVSPSGGFTISKGDIYAISQFFALSKSIPAKTKVDQEVLDEMLKLIVLKTRKSFKPPIANNTGRILSRKVMEAGQITNQIDPTKIQTIGDANGVNQAEFSAFQFIKNIVDQKSVSPAFTGDIAPGRQTATEILELKKQQMMKLGLAIYGIISLERQLAEKRLYNILEHWTQVQDKKLNEITGKIEDVYKMITVDTTLESTQKGKRIIQFTPNVGQYSPDQVAEEEKMLSEQMRVPVRKTYIHPDISKVKYFWHITINPTENDSSDMDRILFKQDVQDAMTLFGPQALNFPYLMKRFAVLSKQDPEKFFVPGATAQPTQAALGGGDQGGLGAQLNRGIGTSASPQISTPITQM